MLYSLFIPISFSQREDLPKESLEAYNDILKLKINVGLEIIKDSESPTNLYLTQLGKTIKILIEEGNLSLNEFEQSSDDALTRIKKSTIGNPQKDYYLAEILLQSAFVHLKHGEDFSAAWEIRKAYRTIVSNVEDFPDFLPHYKTLGLLHVMIGLIPEKHHWIVSLMGMEGTIDEGLKELDQLALANNLFSREAQILIPFINSYVLQKTQEAADGFRQLYISEPDNLLFQYLYSLLLIKNSQSEKAQEVIDYAIILNGSSGYSVLNSLKYMKAEVLLQKGDYANSIIWFQQFINENHGFNFIKDSYYKMGLAYWLLGDQAKALEIMTIADHVGKTNTEADKYASSQLNEELPHRNILKLRFATDGGYYNLAESIIQSEEANGFNSRKEEVEYTYRKARYYHKTCKLQQAMAFYKVTIESSKDEEWYFAPNAALQLGYIYLDSDESDLARKYFKKSLSYKNHEYKTSIDNKAKSALNSMSVD